MDDELERITEAAARGEARVLKEVSQKWKFSTTCAGIPLLHLPVSGGFMHGTKELLTAAWALDVNAQSKDGESALHVACDRGSRDVIVELLLENGANAQLKDETGWTPLHVASRTGRIGAAWLLLSRAQVSLGISDVRGETAMDIAKRFKQERLLKYFTALEAAMAAGRVSFRAADDVFAEAPEVQAEA